MPHLFVDLVRRRHGLGDLVLQQCPETAAQSVDRHLDGAFRRLQLRSNLRIANAGCLAREKDFEALELAFLACFFQLVAETVQNVFEQRERPPPVEGLLRRFIARGLDLILLFSAFETERQRRLRPSPFLGMFARPLVRDEVLERGEQKRSKPTPLRISISECLFFEDSREEGLGEILRLVGRVPRSAEIRVERVPV